MMALQPSRQKSKASRPMYTAFTATCQWLLCGYYMVIIWLIYGYYMVVIYMVIIWLSYGYHMVIIWLMMVNNNLYIIWLVVQ